MQMGKNLVIGVTEMIDRGQIAVGADYIALADYKTKYSGLNPG